MPGPMGNCNEKTDSARCVFVVWVKSRAVVVVLMSQLIPLHISFCARVLSYG